MSETLESKSERIVSLRNLLSCLEDEAIRKSGRLPFAGRQIEAEAAAMQQLLFEVELSWEEIKKRKRGEGIRQWVIYWGYLREVDADDDEICLDSKPFRIFELC